MSFFNFKPARKSQIEELRVVVDLDRLISEPVGFRFQGKVHQINQMTQEAFLRVTNELASLDNLRRKQGHDPVEVRLAYFKLFQKACHTITQKDCENMTDAQIGALCQQIIDCVTGRAQVDDGEKKNLKNQSIH